jgi:hypothetical protein
MSQEFFNKLLSAMEQRAIQEGKYIEFLQFMESRRVKSESIYGVQTVKKPSKPMGLDM